MTYTSEQYEMMELLENGIVWTWFKNERSDAVLHFLMEKDLCTAREDIAPGRLELTELGKIVLSQHHQECEDRAQRKAEKKRERRAQYVYGLFIALATAFFTWAFSHAAEIAAFFCSLMG